MSRVLADAEDLARYEQNATEAEEYERNLQLDQLTDREGNVLDANALDDLLTGDVVVADPAISETPAGTGKVKKTRKPRAKKSTASTAESENVLDALLDGDIVVAKSAPIPPSAPAIPSRLDAWEHLTQSSVSAQCLDQDHGKNWSMYRGDCVEVIKGIPDESVHLSIYSPPFASLYVYSNSERDMGNARDYDEFGQHYAYLIRELYRATKPGRLTAVHCMNLPTSKSHHGYIGIQDFRGDIIREHQKAGWIFHAETVIWKDPVTAMQRTKALGLLHKQIVKDSCMSRMGIPDTMLFFRKDGVNPEPVAGEFDRWIGDESFQKTGKMSIDVWQRFASPIWMDINATRTLQYMQARHDDDERHICPLQLDVIERAMELYSNRDDVILSPFGGIASEGYISVLNSRKFIGIELKDTYWQAACKNLRVAETEANKSRTLFE